MTGRGALNNLLKGQSEYFISDLRGMNLHPSSMFFLSKQKENRSSVMKGQFSYHNHYCGLSVHGGKITELQNLSHCFEIPPGLSFNFLFDGHICFALAGKKYQMGDSKQSKVSCSTIILSAPEILTKYMSKDMQICKLNLFVERSWLESRCNNHEEITQLSRLFQQHAFVTKWIPSKKIIALAKSLLVMQNKKGLIDNLQGESHIVELLALCLKGLTEHLQTTKNEGTTLVPDANKYQLKEKIDDCLKDGVSLDYIASALNMSVSTLQRKFKAAFDITVFDYVRQRRLEIAKTAMVIQGLSVGEAAYLAGYKYPSNFVTAFKKHFNLTPSEFIRSHI